MTDSDCLTLALEALAVRMEDKFCPLCQERIRNGVEHDSDCRLWEIEQEVPDLSLIKPDRSPYA